MLVSRRAPRHNLVRAELGSPLLCFPRPQSAWELWRGEVEGVVVVTSVECVECGPDYLEDVF